MSFPARQTAGQHHHIRAVWNTPVLSQSDQAFGGDCGGVEFFNRNAAVNEADGAVIQLVMFFQIIGDIVGNRDDAFALGDGAVVEVFGFAADIIGGVASAHEMGFGFFAGVIGAPCRSTAADMDDMHVVAFNDFSQGVDVAPHCHGIF